MRRGILVGAAIGAAFALGQAFPGFPYEPFSAKGQGVTPNAEQQMRSVGALYSWLWVNDAPALEYDFPNPLGCQQLGRWLACHYGITYMDECTRMYTIRLDRQNMPYPQPRRSIKHCGPPSPP